jgi:hypothetical protein
VEFFRLDLEKHAENKIGEDWASGRVGDSWIRPDRPSEGEVEAIVRLLSRKEKGHGSAPAAQAALCGGMGVDEISFKGEESLRKLLRG